LSALDELRIETNQGSVPISNFRHPRAEHTVGILNRIDAKRTVTVQGNVAWLSGRRSPGRGEKVVAGMDSAGIEWKLAGSNQDSEEAGRS
jgi:multidrug efflux pump